MAITLRNAANSAVGTALSDAQLAAQLLVTADGFYFGVANPVVLSGGETHSTITGHIIGGPAAGGVGFEASGGNDTLTVQASGLISGQTAAKIGAGGKVVNLGTISGGTTGIESITGDLAIENHGTLRGGTDAIKFSATGTHNALTNMGKIIGNVVGGSGGASGTGLDTLSNTGVITGAVDLKDGNNDVINGAEGKILGRTNLGNYQSYVSNYGFMAGLDTGGNDNSTIYNYGVIRGGVKAANFAYINNSGIIDSISTSGQSTNTYIQESGVVLGNVTDGDGITNMYVYGRINGSVDLGGAYGMIWNSGVIVSNITFGDFGDNYFGKDGFVTYGGIVMGGGDDHVEGGVGTELVTGGLGNDSVDLGGGNDTFIASSGSDGADTVEGGDGLDTYNAFSASNRVVIDLEAGSATGASIGTDVITGFENAAGSNFADFLIGTDNANVFDGYDGADTILGKGGDDRINGWGGADKIVGGLGRDQLTGGDGADVFQYYTAADSTVAGTGRDLILDFTAGTDKIDLAVIDASKAAAGDQAFSYVGSAAFSGVAGELRSALVNGYTVVSGDLNGDKVADFAIQLKGALTLSATDFVL